MKSLLARYAHWLHLRWPAGVPEPLPEIAADGSTAVPGVYIVGDLTGIPLLKFALDSGAKAAARCIAEVRTASNENTDVDIVIIGGGVAGMAAAVACAEAGTRYRVIEGNARFATVANFPAGKPIFTYPHDMTPSGSLQVTADVKEKLLAELEQQVAKHDIPIHSATISHLSQDGDVVVVHDVDGGTCRARRVIIAIGRSGNYRRLNVPGEDLAHVANRLHDPKHYTGKRLVVVGGGDSAVEAAIACADAGADVTLSYRGEHITRAKPDNITALEQRVSAGRVILKLGTTVSAITADAVSLSGTADETVPADEVLILIGREAPLSFFRRSGIPIRGENSARTRGWLIAFLVAITLLYAWKSWIIPPLTSATLPGNWLHGLVEWVGDPTSLLAVMLTSAGSPGFWVTLLYSAAVVGFGIDRMQRRRTPYVHVQTLTLMAIQCLPLFILPELLLPWLAANDLLPQAIHNNLFPDDQWWKAYGFILAWPLMAWNVFTNEPNTWWLIISAVQTFVIIPLIVWRWGKGAYCGWICSCGALAETMGDRHRHKMPHGPQWNRLNFIGQIILATAFVILVLHIISWIAPAIISPWFLETVLMKGYWKHAVDFLLASALGMGLYFWLSGRVWCRFACPLAALMHIYARFTRFRIIVDQKKCISCNACTSVCHQGIDIMNFANKGEHMADPQCVRCSACVQICPTGVLQFGTVDTQGNVTSLDRLQASPVIMKEK